MTLEDPNNLYNIRDPFLESPPMNCSPTDTQVLPVPILPLWSSAYNVLRFLKKGIYLGPRKRRIKESKKQQGFLPTLLTIVPLVREESPAQIFQSLHGCHCYHKIAVSGIRLVSVAVLGVNKSEFPPLSLSHRAPISAS